MTHQCSICLKRFQFASKLQRHQLTHTGHRPFTCLLCGKAFRQAAHLKTHQETHAKQTPLLHDGDPVGDCSGVVPTASQLQGLQEDFPILGFPPQIQEPKLLEQLSEQVTVLDTVKEPEHHWLSPVEWKRSDITAPKHVLQEQQYNSVKPPEGKVHQCAICLKWFASLLHLQRHCLTHSKQTQPKMHKVREKFPQYACDFGELPCGSLNSPETGFLQSFPKGRVKHQCPECPKAFTSPSKLRRHCLIHTGQRPFSCWECGGTFRQRAHLKTHQQTHRKVQKVPNHSLGVVLQVPHLDHPEASESKLPFSCSAKHYDSPEQSQLDSQFQYSNGFASSVPLQDLSLQDNHETEEELSVVTVPGEIKIEESQGLGEVDVLESNTDTDGFKCSVCFKLFPSESALRCHGLSHEEARPFQCGVCSLIFTQQDHLQKHQDKHHNEIQCPSQTKNARSCSSTAEDPLQQDAKPDVSEHNETVSPHSETTALALQLELNIMVKSEHPDRCAEVVQPEVLLAAEQHGERQGPDKVKKNHQCVTCLRRFPAPSKLQRHVLIHTGQRPFGCHVCGKRFRQLTHVKLHAHTHTSPKSKRPIKDRVDIDCVSFPLISNDHTPLVPDPNSYATSEKHLSEEHESVKSVEMGVSEIIPLENDFAGEPVLRSHVDQSQRKHQCLLCSKFFTSPYKLKRHILIHTGQRPFQCISCGKTFRQAVHLKVHQQTHSRLKLYKGALQHKFLNLIRSASRVHAHGRELTYQSQSPETSRSQAVWHKSSRLSGKPVQDNVASTVKKDYDKSRDAISNSKDASFKQKIYECSLCLKCFSAPSKLARHNLIHTGQRPFQCVICHRAFRQLCHLKAHHSIHVRMRPIHQRQSNCRGQNSKNENVRNNTTVGVREGSFTERGTLAPSVSGLEAQTEGASTGKNLHETLGSEGRNRWSYRCSMCDRRFDSQYKLQRHFLTHTGCKPFSCYRKFRQPIHLKRQQQKHCYGTKPTDSQHQEKPDMQSCRESCKTANSDYTHPDYSFSHEDNLQIQNTRCSMEPAAGQESKVNEVGLATVDYESADGAFIRNGPAKLPLPVIQCAAQKQRHSAVEPGGVSWEASPLCSGSCIPEHWTAEAPSRAGPSSSSVSTAKSRTCKAHQCTICLKNFNSPSKLSRHFLIHTGARPFRCPVCAKSFRQVCHLRTHQQIHKGMRHSSPWQRDNGQDHVGSDPPYSGSAPLPDVSTEEKTDHMWLSYITQPHEPDPNHCSAIDAQSEKPQDHVPVQNSSDYELSLIGVTGHNYETLDGVMLDSSSTELSFPITQFPLEKDRHTVQCMSDKPGQQSVSISSPFHFSPLYMVKESETPSVDTVTMEKTNQLQQTECTVQSCNSGSGDGLAVDFQEHFEDLKHTSVRIVGELSNKVDGNLSRNKLRHNCPDCQRCFSSPSKLKRHCLIHAGEKPFRCSICHKAFRQAVHLKFHQRVHASDSTHSKAILQEVAPSEAGGQDIHEPYQLESTSDASCTSGAPAEGTAESWRCPEGGWWEPLSESFSCQQCDITFFTEKELQRHRCPQGGGATARGSGSYQCAICFKNFEAPSKLKRHYVIHTGQRPFQCTFCGKTFTQSSHLKTHQLIHK